MSEKELLMETAESDDLDSDLSDEDSQDELLQKAKKLENDIADNKYLYDSHVELIGIFKQMGDLKSLREAYQRFHEYFPLTPALWLDWINTEKSLATTEDQKEFVFGLFDKAVEDYLSVELWSEYAQYAIGVTSLEKTRIILERAVNAAGMVCNGGHLVWATYREIENLHISLEEDGSEAWKNQVFKCADVFKRELSVPLLNLENTYGEWKQWSAGFTAGLIDDKPVEYGYGKAKKLLETYKPFEDELIAAEANEQRLEIYKKYIKTVSDPSTAICIFERAASQLCLVPDFWLEYCKYAYKLGDQALPVCIKALRNCPWSEELWVFKLRVLENLKKKDSTMLECFEEGISSILPNPGLELWLAFLEYNFRCVNSTEKLDKLFEQAIQQLGFESDPKCQISRLFARILAHRGSVKEARKVWSSILSKNTNKGSSHLWLEFANLEMKYGEPSNVRAVFQRALNAVKDWPLSIADEWLMYERHFGTLDDVMKCMDKCREVNTQYSNYQAPQSNSLQSQKAVFADKGKKRKMHDDSGQVDFKKPRESKPVDTQVEKRKTPVDRNSETTVFISNLLPGVDEKKLATIFPNAVNLEIAMDKKGKSRCFGYVQFKTPEEVMVALARDREPLDGRPVFVSEIKKGEKTDKKPIFKYATQEEKNKLFVRGLPIKKTKEDIAEIFKQHGAIDVRLVLHKSGQPKGLAYIEFESQEKALKALKQTDQMTIDEHVITVAISAPPPKKDKPRGLFGRRDEEEEPIRHARSRLQTSLIPRSLQVKNDAPAKNGDEEKKMRSNSDFRAMLLKK